MISEGGDRTSPVVVPPRAAPVSVKGPVAPSRRLRRPPTRSGRLFPWGSRGVPPTGDCPTESVSILPAWPAKRRIADEEELPATPAIRLKATGGPDEAGDDPVGLAVAAEWRPSAPGGTEVMPHRSGHVGPWSLALTGPIPMYANFWIRFPSKVSVV